MGKATGRARGGLARAKLLTAAERKAIAQRAAAMRWDTENLPLLTKKEHQELHSRYG